MIVYRDLSCNEWWVNKDGVWWYGRGWEIKVNANDEIVSDFHFIKDTLGPSIGSILDEFLEESSETAFQLVMKKPIVLE